ncbi:ABC transporter ATP-binding protein [Paenibacillus pini]|uniref:ABC transporter n=1 Tax=Paenibacillus pini JCM 16418 TaxID=1236976 RepID=W7YHG9_9BACL|nr:ABC transporter ATP-binding protein [Paenibacillus pini]GAF10365.1 ABC transporter [Paenibacillus pini JCM 16418]
MEKYIEVKGLVKQYGEVKALNEVSFSIKKGEVVGIVGPNGSGKTTLLKIMLGLIDATSGSVSIAGIPVFNNSMDARRKIGIVMEDQGLYGQMKVRKYLEFFAKLYGFSSLTPSTIDLMESLDLQKYEQVEIAKLSKGNKQKVSIVRSMIHNPEIIFLDEATDHLDPEVRESVIHHIKHFRSQGKTILMCSHNLHEVEQVANEVLVLKFGQLIDNIRLDNKHKQGSKTKEHFMMQVMANPVLMNLLTKRWEQKIRSVTSEDEVTYTLHCEVDHLDEMRRLMLMMAEEGITVFDLRRQQSQSLNEMYMSVVKEAVHQ